MPSYRLYRLDGAGKIVRADWIAADADGEAIKYAQERADTDRFELWEQGRLVSRSPPDSR